jgi:hypothetical protein
MRRTCAGLVASVLLALGTAGVARAACTASETTLCLNEGRFSASVAWKDFQGRTGVGTAIPITTDTGYFWFFSSTNIELVVKVLDARPVNGKYWVFFGALSNVEYTLTVTDTVTGARKQYVNPSGQFASVGDTKAFDPNGAAGAVVERVEGTFAPPESIAAVQGLIDSAATKATADFTPCPSAPNNLWLNGCRFRLQVDWQASDGRSGEGTGVQLTNDTGYFWFFNAANVELMVKVLDARAVNGNIWIFFGALSNVQYTLTVFDTLTNTARTYTNPNGSFASVGDTSAFHGGKSVSAVKDSTKAVSQDVDSAGATLTAAGADGTVYTLVLAPDSIYFPTEITMTPLDHIGGFPFSGGLKGGVQLEPEGLMLLEAATLTITPPAPIPPAELAPFSYEGSGENFILYPRILNVPGVQLPITHFSGYGAGSAGPGEVANQGGITPSGPFAPYAQRAAELEQQADTGQITSTQRDSELQQLFIDAYNQVVVPALQAVQSCDEGAAEAAVRLTMDWSRTAGFFLSDATYASLQLDALQEIKRIVLACIDEAFQKCVSQNDTGQVRLIMSLIQKLLFLGLVDDNEYANAFGKVERCLRFEVDFDSSIQVSNEALTVYQKVQAVVPMRLAAGQSNFYLEGSGTTQFLLATLAAAGANPCSYPPSTTRNSTFDALRLAIGGPEREAYDVKLLYAPGQPLENDHSVCPGVGANDTGFISLWAGEFEGLHPDEVTVLNPVSYTARAFEIIPYGNFVAKKLYERATFLGEEPATESTHILVKHTPDAPNP